MIIDDPQNNPIDIGINSANQEQDSALTFITWNVGMLLIKRLSYVIVEPAAHKHMRLHYLPDALNECPANIVALQELFDPHDVAYVIHKTRKRFPYYSVAEYKSSASHLNPGLVVLSDKPIMHSKFYPFKIVPPDEAMFVRKGILHCTIDAGNFGKLQVVNTHNTSGGMLWSPHNWLMHKVRKMQYRQTYKFLEKFPDESRILMGDFNSSPEASYQSYSELKRPGFLDAWALHHGPEPEKRKPTWDVTNLLNVDGPHSNDVSESLDGFHIDENLLNIADIHHLDIVFTDPVVRGPNDQKITISDHYGVQMRLGLKK